MHSTHPHQTKENWECFKNLYLVTAEGNIYPHFHRTPLEVCITSSLVSILLQLSQGDII